MWKDSESHIDYIDFEYIAKLVNDIILDDSLLPASIGVYGDWGSGKSSIMSISQKKLKDKDDKILIVNFNAWLFEGYDEIKTTIINYLLDSIEEKRTIEGKAKETFNGLRKSLLNMNLIPIISKGFFSALTAHSTNPSSTTPELIFGQSENIKEFIDTVKDNYLEATSDEKIRNEISNFREKFGELIKETNISRVVIYIDEIDRCSTETILEIFEAMRLFMFSGKVAFIYGADERQIAYAIKQKYSEDILDGGSKIDIGKEYLEKIVQYPVRIPRMNVAETELYITLLLSEDGVDDDKFLSLKSELINQYRENLSSVSLPDKIKDNGIIVRNFTLAKRIAELLNFGLNGNPRQFKRFLNEFELRKRTAELKEIEINDQVLVKVMVLQYVKPSIFTDFMKLQQENKLNDVLSYYQENEDERETDDQKAEPKESNQIKKQKSDKKWKDEWFEQWVKTEPDIINHDLKPYFYLSRNKGLESVSFGKVFSNEAVQIIKAYLSGSSIAIFNTEGNIKNISSVELNLIVERFFEEFIKQPADKRFSVFKGLIDLSTKRNECADFAVQKISGLPSNYITPPMKKYAENLTGLTIPASENMRKVIQKWDEKNNGGI
ncbi:KAP family NTPase [Streptococcus sp. CSL10205-OR2]|uniref:KAP family P-loop NTPase fold protein n=1 Tax=Streptococcus sp. CSL10205-OR2 TaxID=2980558 RepID=UPI0021D8BADD|nr:KAP family NTPase [Streptococcus sp. CSL10205-OR2]MCU9534000.1 KAP family NTPase [Streptococcus sp. CSL10205-OR2]